MPDAPSEGGTMSRRLIIRTRVVLVACFLALTVLAPAAQGGVGTITEFPIPTPFSYPYGIAPGPDGNLWFTEARSNNIGRITPTGTFAEFPIPTADSEPIGIA